MNTVSNSNNTEKVDVISSAPAGIRTPNPLIRSQMLYPLSYGRLVKSRLFSLDNLSNERNYSYRWGICSDLSLLILRDCFQLTHKLTHIYFLLLNLDP
jgi:hypothetical protein